MQNTAVSLDSGRKPDPNVNTSHSFSSVSRPPRSCMQQHFLPLCVSERSPLGESPRCFPNAFAGNRHLAAVIGFFTLEGVFAELRVSRDHSDLRETQRGGEGIISACMCDVFPPSSAEVFKMKYWLPAFLALPTLICWIPFDCCS